MATAVTRQAPGKLNLFLHITGRRADGYHLIQTVYQFIDRCDTLDFSVRRDGEIFCRYEGAEIAAGMDLCRRAAQLLQHHTGCRSGVDIEVTKRLPIGAGLGGGSSDAACVLVTLNALWQLNLDAEMLEHLGLQLGADVPVFVRGHAAWAEGIGERLTPVTLDEPWFAVLTPPVAVATAPLYQTAELTRDCPPITIADFLSGRGGNVFEEVVRARYPEVATALDWHDAARLTGTGSAVYLRCDAAATATALLAQAPYPGFVARGLNQSPLYDHADTLPRWR